jgi:acid phosphatase
MPRTISRRQVVINVALIVCGLGVAFATGSWVTALAQQAPTAPPTYLPESPPFRGLDANLYMQTSAEYRACCYQAYNLATLRLKEALAKKPAGKPAVIMDLDETVLDNAGFQAMQSRSKLAYDQRLWDRWEENDGDCVALIPGAKEFIHEARKSGVAVAYISNRGEKFRSKTKLLLTRLDIPAATEDLLKLSTDTSNKSKRRVEVEVNYNVLLLVGDNLRDFDEKLAFGKFDKTKPEEVAKAILARKDAVDKERSKWGDRWIILPNPAYGEWPKPFGQGKADLNYLAPMIPSK